MEETNRMLQYLVLLNRMLNDDSNDNYVNDLIKPVIEELRVEISYRCKDNNNEEEDNSQV